jgi:L-iditol 2-dehydrogenase
MTIESVPKNMKVAVYYSNDDVRLHTTPVPKINQDEILVKTEACGLCGGETMEWYLKPRAPKVLGHEITGTIAKIGEGVSKFAVGDRVVLHHHVSCMSCHSCLRGNYTLCEQYSNLAIDPGGQAEYVRVLAPVVEHDTFLLPDHISFKAGVAVEPLGCVMNGIRKVRIHPGDTIAILGVGFMGIGFTALCSIWPVSKIVVLDFNDWRLNKAREFGATHTINPKKEDPHDALRALNQGRLADVLFFTAPNIKAWELGLSLVEKGGTFHTNAPPHPDDFAKVNPSEFFFKEITLNAAYSASHIDTRAVLDLMIDKRFDAEAMITHQFGLDQVSDAIKLMLEGGESLKPVILPSLTKGEAIGEIALTHKQKNIFTT